MIILKYISNQKRKNRQRITRIKAAALAAVFALAGISGYTALTQPVPVYAEVQMTGKISPGVTGVRIRTSTDTSNTSNVITKVNAGFSFDILETVQTSDVYAWYRIGFYLNGSYREGYVTSQYVTVDENNSYTEDTDFEAYLEEQGFPESYKDGLRQIHAKYPKWVFIADFTGKDWNEVVENENVLGRSLIYSSAQSSWKSTAQGCYDWESGTWIELDSGGWVQASSELVQYALDPRNFFNETNIFMFEDLSYNSSIQNEGGVGNVVSGTFMQDSGHDLSYEGTEYNYPSALMLAGRLSGVSPYHLATRIIQEQGRAGQGNSISGTVSGYEGYYNYYNQGAYKSGNISAVENGLIYAGRSDEATMRPWDTRMKSIIGGAVYIGSKYINRGQNTLYYEKFDLISPYWHQYMTNILAPRSESQTASNAYSADTKSSTPLAFRIPIYENMPETACEIPQGDGSPNNTLSDLNVDGFGLTPTFSRYTQEYDLIVENDVTGINISAAASDGTAEISGAGYYELNVGLNSIQLSVYAQNGSIRTYTIHVVRKEGANPGGGEDDNQPGYSSDYVMNSEAGTISGIGVGSAAQDVLNGITFINGAYGKVYAADGSENDQTVGTGNRIVIYDGSGNVLANYEVIIYGDVNGDGSIDLLDIVKIKRYMLGTGGVEGAYYQAADTNRDGEPDLLDIVAIKNHMLGKRYIPQ